MWYVRLLSSLLSVGLSVYTASDVLGDNAVTTSTALNQSGVMGNQGNSYVALTILITFDTKIEGMYTCSESNVTQIEVFKGLEYSELRNCT